MSLIKSIVLIYEAISAHRESFRQGKEGKVFGGGSRASVAITLLVKNPKKAKAQAEIFYHDIGDYLSREAKLQKIRENSLESLDWQKHHPQQKL